jgi:hypothetical protein
LANNIGTIALLSLVAIPAATAQYPSSASSPSKIEYAGNNAALR